MLIETGAPGAAFRRGLFRGTDVRLMLGVPLRY